MPFLVEEIARLVGGTVTGNPKLALTGVNSLDLATPDELSFVVSSARFKDAGQSKAGCVMAPPGFTSPDKTVITVDQPKVAFAKVMHQVQPDRRPQPGVHPSAVVDPSATVAPDASVGPLAVIGRGAVIGAKAVVDACTVIGEGVRIGADTRIYPNVTVYHGVIIGARVILHSGCVIGADGFGFVTEKTGTHVKVPQLGNVVIEDDVEIGANCAVDRATFGSTVIKRGTKMDNLIQVAHNVQIGEHSLLAAQVGIAGSSKIGHHVVLAGQVGVSDNATVGDCVVIGAKSGLITGQKVASNQTVWGFPARPIKAAKRLHAAGALLPKLIERIRLLDARLKALEETSKKSPPASS